MAPRQRYFRRAGLGPVILVAILLAIFQGLAGPARADWRFDTATYLSSAHGDMGCLDCHENLDGVEHPDPSLVNRQASFFSAQSCYACHAEVEDDLAQGRHAGFKAVHPERFAACVDCHDPHAVGADPAQAGAGLELSPDDQACMACHAEPENLTAGGSPKLCLSCHGAESGLNVALVSQEQFSETVHGSLDCASCHIGSDTFPHKDQTLAPCLSCHERHTESEIGDAHLGVTCQACHLKGVSPHRLEGTTLVGAVIPADTGRVTDLHQMRLDDDESCGRCHYSGNTVGAANVALPPKSVLCVVCHTASFTVQDTVSWIGLLGFLAGLALLGLVAAKCAAGTKTTAMDLAGAFVRGAAKLAKPRVAKALLMDVLLQRRLYRRDRKRWLIHACIFWPFAIRCLWGLTALFGTIFLPSDAWVWELVDKNNPATAFVFDLTGLVLLAGIVMAWLRGNRADASRLPGAPAQDKLLLALIGTLVMVGFVLEGLRIAVTGAPPSSGYAFAGYALSAFFAHPITRQFAQAAYAWGWYAHAILTAACFIYLPFSRLSHVIFAPIVLAMKAADAHDHGQK